MNSTNPSNSFTSIIPIDPSITLVHHFLEHSARLYPDKVAIIHGKVRTTYSEINTRADNLANYLISIGAQKGDRIALLMENCVEYVVSYYGIMKAGAVAVPLNSDLKPEGLRYAIEDLNANVLISSSRFEKLIIASDLCSLGLTHLILKSPHELTAMSYEPLPSAPLSSDLASIIYTSGSTGGPKGVMLTHRNIVDNVFSICQYLHLTENDIQMCVLPFFYVMGKSLLNTHIAVGGTIVVNNQFAFPASVLKEMIAEKVTGFSGVPSTFAYLLHRSPLAAVCYLLIQK
jgi:long-chain acyl-CoA synthetase